MLVSNFGERLVPVQESTDILSIDGFIGKPQFARKTRGEQFFYVNKRFIKHPYFHHAVENAFEELEFYCNEFKILGVYPQAAGR